MYNYPPCSLLLKVVVVRKSIVSKSQSFLPFCYLCVLPAFTTSQCMFLQWHFWCYISLPSMLVIKALAIESCQKIYLLWVPVSSSFVLSRCVSSFYSIVVHILATTFWVFLQQQSFSLSLSYLVCVVALSHILHLGCDEASRDLFANPFFSDHHGIAQVSILCFEIKNETLDFMGEFLPSNNKFLFQAKRTTMVLHQFKMFCNFKVLMMTKMNNKVKTISIVRYLNFIMT